MNFIRTIMCFLVTFMFAACQEMPAQEQFAHEAATQAPVDIPEGEIGTIISYLQTPCTLDTFVTDCATEIGMAQTDECVQFPGVFCHPVELVCSVTVDAECYFNTDKGDDGCKSDSECDDGVMCTYDNCVNDACTHTDIPMCCSSDAECDGDLPYCVETSLSGDITGWCQECKQDADNTGCADGQKCAGGGGPTGPPLNETKSINYCVGCTVDSDCADDNPCTNEFCGADGTCTVSEMPGCTVCATDADCAELTEFDCDANLGLYAVFTYECMSSGMCDLGNIDIEECFNGCSDDGTCAENPPEPSPQPECTTDNDCADMVSYECDIYLSIYAVVSYGCAANGTCQPNNYAVSECYECNADGTCAKTEPDCTSNSECNDGDACTQDYCWGGQFGCENTPIPDCQKCSAASDCNDGNQCTTDTCKGGACSNVSIEVCNSCDKDADCADLTEYSCENGKYEVKYYTCNSEKLCEYTAGSSDPCTSCNSDGSCGDFPSQPEPQCQVDADCKSFDQYTCGGGKANILYFTCNSDKQCEGTEGSEEACAACNNDGTCLTPGVPAPACTTDADCDNGNPCTQDDCVGGSCTSVEKLGCLPCDSDANCDDSIACTTDICASGICQHVSQSMCQECSKDDDCIKLDQYTCENGTFEILFFTCNDQKLCEPTEGSSEDCSVCNGDGSCGDYPYQPKPQCQADAECASFNYSICSSGKVSTWFFTCNDDKQCEATSGSEESCDVCKSDGTCGDGEPEPPVCVSDSDCEDSNPCTEDHCLGGALGCEHTPIPGCVNCLNPEPCDDGDPCTYDWCTVSGKCVNSDDGSCTPDVECSNSWDCDDGDSCTTDGCNTAGECYHVANDSCGTPCVDDSDCVTVQTDGTCASSGFCDLTYKSVVHVSWEMPAEWNLMKVEFVGTFCTEDDDCAVKTWGPFLTTGDSGPNATTWTKSAGQISLKGAAYHQYVSAYVEIPADVKWMIGQWVFTLDSFNMYYLCNSNSGPVDYGGWSSADNYGDIQVKGPDGNLVPSMIQGSDGGCLFWHDVSSI